MEDEEIINALNEAFKVMAEQEVMIDHYRIFAPKVSYYAIKECNYFVIGTRLVVNPCFIKRKKDRKLDNAYWDEFYDLNVDYAESYKTRNEALRAVARNRKGLREEPKFNEHSFMKDGIEVILQKSISFENIDLDFEEGEEYE